MVTYLKSLGLFAFGLVNSNVEGFRLGVVGNGVDIIKEVEILLRHVGSISRQRTTQDVECLLLSVASYATTDGKIIIVGHGKALTRAECSCVGGGGGSQGDKKGGELHFE